jgi:NADH-quinone oxidoreductase subunit M
VHLLLITVLLPLFGAAAMFLLPRNAAALHRSVALAVSGLTLVSTLAIGIYPDLGCCGGHSAFSWGGIPALGISLTLVSDGLSRPLAALAGLVGFMAVLASGGIRERTRTFYVLLLLAIGSAVGAFSSRNLFFLYFFAELAALPEFLLITAWGALPPGSTDTRERAAMQIVLYLVGAALVVLVALAMLFAVAGTFDLDTLSRLPPGRIPVSMQIAIYGLFLLGAGVWASMWPFHLWAPAAYAAAPAPAAMFFAGVTKNFGAYLLLRVGLQVLPEGAAAWSAPLAVLATINVLYAGWAAMRQRDWNRLIAYASISHAGYLLLALAAGGVLGWTAAVVFMFAHGVGSAMLFALSGWLFDATGRRDTAAGGGLARVAPFAGTAMAMAVLAAVGLPGFGNFAGEIMIFAALWRKQTLIFQVATIASVWTVVTTAVYFLRALRASFHGPFPADAPAPKDAGGRLRFVAVVLILVSLAIGVAPGLIAGPARDASRSFEARPELPAEAALHPAAHPAPSAPEAAP